MTISSFILPHTPCLLGVQQNKSAIILGIVLIAAGFFGFALLKLREQNKR